MVISAMARMDGGRGGLRHLQPALANLSEAQQRLSSRTWDGGLHLLTPSGSACPFALRPEVKVLLAAPSPVLDLCRNRPHTLVDLQVGRGSCQTQGPSSQKPCSVHSPHTTPMPDDAHNHKAPSPPLLGLSGPSRAPYNMAPLLCPSSPSLTPLLLMHRAPALELPAPLSARHLPQRAEHSSGHQGPPGLRGS